MRVLLGRYMDGGAWPDVFHLSGGVERTAVDGVKICGPAGFLSLLEEKLGLPVCDTHASVRIAAWESAMAGRMGEAGREEPFYAASFAADSWSTARHILNMRDELVLLGVMEKLEGSSDHCPARLGELLLLEQRTRRSSGKSDVPGHADRFRLILRQLRSGWPVPAADSLNVELLTARSLWDKPWKELFDELEKRGVRMSGESAAGTEDGMVPEVHMLRGDSLSEAAEALAAMLAARRGELERIVIIRPDESPELDSALRRRCGVSTGCRPCSSSRPYMHLVTLYLRLHLLPFDPEVLRQFLLLPLSPVDTESAAAFLRALNRSETAASRDAGFWPGAWKRELFVDGHILPGVDAARRWLFPERRPDADSISCADMEKLASELRSWAWSTDTGEPELQKVAELCTRTMEAARQKKERMSRLEFEKMLASILGDGERHGQREAMPWAVLSDPGQLFGPADTVVWWDFSDPGTALRESVRWDQTELAWMGELAPEGPESRRRVQKLAWNAPFRHAEQRLVLVVPRMKGGEPAAEHPAMSGLKALNMCRVEAADVLGLSSDSSPEGLWKLKTEVVPSRPEPFFWREEDGHPCGLPEEIYPSTLEQMLECPAAWYFGNVLKLDSFDFPLAPDPILRGNIAHSAVEKVLKGECPCTEEGIAEELLRAARRQAARFTPDTAANVRFDMARRLHGSIFLLKKKMEELNLRFVDCEQTWTAAMQGTESVCRGSYDIALGPADGEGISHIVDLKWSKSDRYARAVKKGLCVQLVLYWYLLGHGKPVGQGSASSMNHSIEDAWYLLLVSQKMVAGQGNGDDFAVQWERLKKSLEELREEFGRGFFRLAGKENGKPAQSCTYCSYRALCGMDQIEDDSADDGEEEE